MGKLWRKYQVGQYRLGHLKGQAVAIWRDADGHHRRRLGHAPSEVAARALLDQFARNVAVLRAANGATVGQIWRQYVADRLADGKQAPQFSDSWRALAPRFEAMQVDAITADVCRDYTRDRIAAGVSQGTVWTELTKLRSCINWALKRRAISSAPYVWIPSKPPPKQRVLTPDEAIALMDACVMPHVRLFILLALTTGARSGAILGLTWDRVDLERLTIDLREPNVIDPLTKRVRKNRAIVPITELASAALVDARAGALSPHVIEWVGEPVANIRKGFMAAASRAGLSDVTPHTLRHTAASWATSSGENMELVARLLGHRDPKTTRTIYAKPDVDSLRPAADVIDMRIRRRAP
jgi:integrase